MKQDTIEWEPIESAPEGVPIKTMIADGAGVRNFAILTKRGNLWWTDQKDGMYVYYRPTHWHL